MKNLKVFQGLDIPVDYAATQKYVTLGASDSGKTFMLARYAEQCAKANIFFVLLDPVGKHWSLRAGPDGTSKGGIDDIYVIGGLHGDVPLDPASGALVADTVVDHPGRYVIDVSQFETDQDVYNFAAAFAKRLFRRKAKDAGWPLLLMLEEAEWFLPQNPQQGQQTMKGAFGRIVRQGRNHGIGVFLVFQRSAAADKGAISQCKVLIAKAMSHKRDREAVDEWVKSNGTEEQRDEMMQALASMGVEEAYVWDPRWLKVFKRVKVLHRETFDSSANVKHGSKMQSVELVPLDVDALGEKMKELAERAEEDDPKKLRKKIADLEDRARRGDQAREDAAVAERALKELEAQLEELRNVPVQQYLISKGDLDVLKSISDELAGVHLEFEQIRTAITGSIEKNKDLIPKPKIPEMKPTEPAPAPPKPSQPAQPVEGLTGKLEKEVLRSYVAFYPTAPTPAQLGIVLGKSYNAGPFRGAINKVVSAGYVDENGRASDAARSQVGPATLPSPEEIQQMWRKRFNGTQLQIFNFIIERYPETVSPEEIGQAIGKNHNAGPIRGMFNDLDKLQVAVYNGDGVRASDLLFDPRG